MNSAEVADRRSWLGALGTRQGQCDLALSAEPIEGGDEAPDERSGREGANRASGLGGIDAGVLDNLAVAGLRARHAAVRIDDLRHRLGAGAALPKILSQFSPRICRIRLFNQPRRSTAAVRLESFSARRRVAAGDRVVRRQDGVERRPRIDVTEVERNADAVQYRR